MEGGEGPHVTKTPDEVTSSGVFVFHGIGCFRGSGENWVA